jgi:succinate dehydrogenase / fumarate reductase, cytochrome b subunit
MSLLGNLFSSSVGRKFLMAITGLVLVGFVFGHLVGNLQIFAHPDQINGYAEFLHSLGPVLWLMRGFLLLCLVVHVWAAVVLTLENRAARGPEEYAVKRFLRASVASRYMRMSGVVVLAFIIYHLLHFTIGMPGDEGFKGQLGDYVMAGGYSVLGFPVVAAGTAVADVYSMVFIGFSHPLVALFYLVAVGLLSVHLWHGADSMFQTIGWRNSRWSVCLQRVVALLVVLYFLGNLAIPGAIFSGLLTPAEGTYAALQQAAVAATP